MTAVHRWRPEPTSQPLTAPEAQFRKHWPWLAAVLVTAVALYQWQVHRQDLASWDWLLVSGTVLFVVLFPLSLSLPDRATECLDELVAGEALIAGDSPVPDATGLQRKLNGQSLAWAYLGAAVAAGLMVIAWIWSGRVTAPNALLFVLEVLGAVLAGLYLGRAIGYGRMGRWLSGQGISIKARPGHPDGVAGLRPVGQLFLFNASIFAAIAAFLGIWSLTGYFDSDGRYAHWRGPYLVLLGAVVAFSFLAFLVPLRWFHERMREQKHDYVTEADRAASKALAMREVSLATEDDESRHALDTKVERLTRWFEEVQAMPTWPVDKRIRKRFTSNQLLVLLPLVLKVLSLDETWTSIWSRVGEWLAGGDA